MKVVLLGMLLITLGLAGNAAEPVPAKAEKLMDTKQADQVPVVLRVELLKAATAVEKYGYDEVKVLQVYKNDTRVDIPNEVTLAFRNTDSGLLPGVTTVYLADYHTPPAGKMWRVVKKSHHEKK